MRHEHAQWPATHAALAVLEIFAETSSSLLWGSSLDDRLRVNGLFEPRPGSTAASDVVG